MYSTKQTAEVLPEMKELQPLLTPFQEPSLKQSIWQLCTSLLPYLLLWYLMVRSLAVSYWLTLALMVPAAGFLARIFIIFHDCGHNSFFASTKDNKIVGSILGLLVFTPGEQWWHSHAIHHATASNLDKRGVGDVKTLTVQEYLNSSRIERLKYRLFRFPPIMFLLGPFYMFIIMQRFALPRFGKKETNSVIYANIALAAIAIAMSFLIGWKAYLFIQIPLMSLAGAFGIWLFYVQHQFEYMYWDHNDQWSYVASALKGASYYKLPRLLKWFSGNIGFHHIHHLSPRIPNYYLDQCYAKNPLLQKWGRKITLWSSFKCMKYSLWDEVQRKMIGFGDLKAYQTVPVRATTKRSYNK
jgi:acyl-lipid omega-6 desaturase (Delta-12 desaturase)